MTSYFIAMASIAFIYCLLALGLNIQWGHTGLINFGHVASFAIGAYTSAILSLQGIPVIFSLLAGTILAGLAAYPIGIITIRLKEDYLAIVTLGFSEIIRLICLNEMWLTRGPMGLPNVPNLFSWWGPRANEWLNMFVFLVVMVCVFLLLQRLIHSPFGRVLRAIKEDEYAASALGKNVVAFKMKSLIIGAAIAGIAGGLYAHYMSYIVPEMFLPVVTFYVWVAVILGGSGSNLGAILGSIILFVFLEGTRFLGDLGFPLDKTRFASLRFVIVGLGLILLVLYRPQGLLGKGK